MNPHEDNEWADKFSEKNIIIPHYYSKEEKEKWKWKKSRRSTTKIITR